MSKKLDLRMAPRIAHYFRDVNLTSNSRPELIPAQFPMNCESGDDQWSAGFLLRIAVRFQHLCATYGNRNGKRTIKGQQPAVCFSPFNLADLIAVRNGLPPQNEAAKVMPPLILYVCEQSSRWANAFCWAFLPRSR